MLAGTEGISYLPYMADSPKWRWRYDRWVGIMWGPLPVGLLIIAVGFTALYFVYYVE